MTSKMIEIDNVVAGYSAEVDILKGISLEVARSEIVTLLGPNGCGKSTLLKTIAGQLLPRSGQVKLNGQNRSQMPIFRKIRECSLGFVPQTENIFSNLTVRENLQVGGHYMSTSACKSRMDELYAACYSFESGLWREVKGPGLIRPESVEANDNATLAGNVFVVYGDRLPTSAALRVAALPTASALLRLAPGFLANGGALPAELALPLYIRDKVAKTTAEREAEKVSAAA